MKDMDGPCPQGTHNLVGERDYAQMVKSRSLKLWEANTGNAKTKEGFLTTTWGQQRLPEGVGVRTKVELWVLKKKISKAQSFKKTY